MDTLLQDIRYAMRTIAKAPGFAVVAILCLALGIGVNSTIFSVVDTILIRPLPFPSPEELVRLVRTYPPEGIDGSGLSYPEIADFRQRAHALTDLAGENTRSFLLSDGDEPERLS